MLDLAYRNIMRQRSRTVLTFTGILIGIAAIVALGSISEGIRGMVQEELSLISGKVTVVQAGSEMMTGATGSDITEDQIDELYDIPGVKDVVPMTYHVPTSLGVPVPSWYIIGIEPSKIEIFTGENVMLIDGEMLADGSSGEVMIGNDVSENQNLVVGDTITFKEADYFVIGILEKTDVSDIDMAVIMPLEELQDALDKETYQMALVIPDNPAEAESISDSIDANIEGLDAISDKDIARMAEEIVSTISLFTFSIGGIAAFVGGLSIMNTMIMSVMERKREIGTMKAMGATSWSIIRQIVTESAMISLIGAAGGIILGSIAALGIGSAIGSNMISASITPGLLLTALGFALILGILGGLYPARKAVLLDPVEALRYE